MIIQSSKINSKKKPDRRFGPIVSIKIRNKKINLCFCHRLPERSLTIVGYTLPLCARCTGIVIGSILGIILYYLNIIFMPLIYVLLLFPLIIDGVTQLLNYRQSTNVLRLTTGILFGVGYVSIGIYLFNLFFSFLEQVS